VPRRRPGAEQLQCAGLQLVLARAGAALRAPAAREDLAGEGALACTRSPSAAGQQLVMGLAGVVGQHLGRGAPASLLVSATKQQICNHAIQAIL
jgi:hypothetical protein